MRARLAASFLTCAVLLAWPALAQSRSPVLPDVGFDQKLGTQLPLDLTFRDEAGRAVRLGDLFGRRPVVLAFAYHTCPMLCGLVQEGIASALKPLALEAGRDFDVVVVSIDPADTPERAAAAERRALDRYGRRGAGRTPAAGFHYLTGRDPAIEALADAAGFRYRRVPERGEYAHAAGVVVAAPDGTVARYLFGIELAPRDLRLALVEAAAGKIGTAVDQILLYCFHYDPALGRYSAAVMNLVRLAGAATALGLVGFVLVLRRRDSTNGEARAGASLAHLEGGRGIEGEGGDAIDRAGAFPRRSPTALPVMASQPGAQREEGP